MNTPPSAAFRPGLEPVLCRLRRRIRRVQAARGALATLVAALASLLVLVALDAWLSPLPPAARWALTLAWVVLVAAVAVVGWWRLLRQPLGLLRIARWLEVRHPELEERVSTALELAAASGGGVSADLLDELCRAASADLAGINPRAEVSARRVRRWLAPALALVACWAVLFVVAPGWTARHLVRALAPESRLGNAAHALIVEPGSTEMIEADPLRVVVRRTGPSADLPVMVMRLPDGGSLSQPMAADGGAFVRHLDKVTAGFDYEIRAGRLVSDRFRVTVLPRPRLADARVRLEFPAYTGMAAREVEVGDGLAAVAGTRAKLRTSLNTPVKSATFTLDGTTAGRVIHQPTASGGALTVDWGFDRPGRQAALLTLRHRLGREFEAARFQVETRADAVPEVRWTRPAAKDLKVRPDEVLGLAYLAHDDFGLGTVVLEVEPGRGERAEFSQAPPVAMDNATPPAWRGKFPQPVGALRDRWPGANSFKLRMRVADARPPELGGPQAAVSEWLTLRLDSGAEPLARREMFAANAVARQTVEQARQAAEQARWRIESKRDELRKGEVGDASRKELAAAREQLADARERLGELAGQVGATPLAPFAEDMRAAAEKAEEAGRKLEETPLQDHEQAREEMAAAAGQAAEDAGRLARELLERMAREEPRLHDLARLRDLAQRQQELARQAGQPDAGAPADPPVSPEWRQQQSQASWETRDLAAQHPQARAEALAREAARARELAAEAREQAAAQQALGENAAAQPADAPGQAQSNGLREELAKAQAAIRDAVQEQLAAAGEQRDEPLGDLAERQRQVAAAARDLAVGHAAAARQQLAQMRAGQVAGLARDIREAPQVGDGPEALRQAGDAASQAAGHAANAAQQAQPSAAAAPHAAAAEQLQQAAERLGQAADALAGQAGEAAGQTASQPQAPMPSAPLADAFQQSARAARSESRAGAAAAARAAADSLAKAVQATESALRQGSGPPQADGPPGLAQGQPGPPGAEPGTSPDENSRNRQADPGVPPELAALGVSAGDWERIKTSLKAETGGAAAVPLPEGYRELVRRYFEEMAKGDRDE